MEVRGWEACVVLLMPLSLSFSVSDTWDFRLLTHLRGWVCLCVFVSVCLCGCVLECTQHVRSPVRMGLGLMVGLVVGKPPGLTEACPVQFSSVAQSCPTLCDPMNRSTPGLPVHHQLPEFTQTYVHRVSDAIQPSHLLSSPSPPAPIPPSIRVFSSESTLRMKWPKYWSFSLSIIPSNEHPGLVSLRMDWLDLLAV